MEQVNSKGIVVFGHPRSGTTLTRRLLNRHSNIASPPETHLFRACGKFLDYEQTSTGLDIGVLSGLKFAGLEEHIVLNRLRDLAFSCLDDFAQSQGKQRWLEKTAFDAFHMKNIVKLLENKVLFIGIVRHPLDVAMSCNEFCQSLGYFPKELHKYIIENPNHIAAFTKSWADVNADLLWLQSEFADNCKIFRYEDLVSAPKDTLSDMLAFVGESYESHILDSELDSEKIIGFSDHKSYQSKHIQNNRTEKWRNLPKHQVYQVASVVNPLLNHFGYPLLSENKKVTLEQARMDYSQGLQIVSNIQQAGEEDSYHADNLVIENKGAPFDCPKISIYGDITNKRVNDYYEKQSQVNEKLATQLLNRQRLPDLSLLIALQVLLKRIGDDNKVELDVCSLEQGKTHHYNIPDIHDDEVTLAEIEKEYLSIATNNKVAVNDTFNFKNDVVTCFFEHSTLFNEAIDDYRAFYQRNLGTPNFIKAICLFVLVDKKSETIDLYWLFNKAAWLNSDKCIRAIEHFNIILNQFLTEPNQTIAKLPILTTTEKNLIDSFYDFKDEPEPVISKVWSQVVNNPFDTAIVFEESELTYLELGLQVSILSKQLQLEGVTHGSVVAVCIERSTNMIIALLAIMHAGGTYVPLDPEHPKSRILQIIEDANIDLVVSDNHFISELTNKVKIKNFLVQDAMWEQQEDIREPSGVAELAYIIFTSGSTGRPKGVEVYQKGLTCFLTAMSQKPGMDQSDRMLSVTTVAFDIAALEIFLPLTLGATLYMASRDDTKNGLALEHLLTQNKITVFQATPATYQLLLANNWQGNKSLKLLCGGEAMPSDLAEKLITRCDSLWNMYGPTETTIWSTVKQVSKVESPVPIGTPIRGTKTYVLNNALSKVPIGVIGELYIAGDGVAAGYHNKPDLTGEKFVDDPYAKSKAAKMYRTGDFAKYTENGELVFLGRQDSQVKIRGFRIELEDIENAIRALDGVSNCVVDVYTRSNSSKQLVAYIISDGNHKHYEEGELTELLNPVLPNYMIPSYIVYLGELPLTPNKKVDRKSLPHPEVKKKQSPSDSSFGDTESQNKVETTSKVVDVELRSQILKVYQKTLNIKDIQASDSFASLGGDSLSYVQTSIELESALGKIPEGWEKLTINALASKKELITSKLAEIDTTVFMRALAMLSVIFVHSFSDIGLRNNTAGLFMISGLLFAKFQFDLVQKRKSVKPILMSAWKIFLPATVITLLLFVKVGEFRLDIILLYSNYTEPVNGFFVYYWFIQVLIHILLLYAFLFSINPIFKFASAEPYKFGVAMLAVSALLIPITALTPELFHLHRSTHVNLWFFAAGWLIYFSKSEDKRVYLVYTILFLAIIHYVLLESKPRETIASPLLVFLFAAILLFVEKIKVTHSIKKIVYVVASSSLFIYLTHMIVLVTVPQMLPFNLATNKIISIFICLVWGAIVWKCWEHITESINKVMNERRIRKVLK
ncbi:amino acid adenylation domain-containing protein [Thalassotalea sp. Y01]|uniref:amino acid adenylation domain-containing protein n=1 Tax=Thalassotalea sp. Y01 TaxID=2729613 RepID=UPI00145F83C7|nr:amino acid adenylation domain-containing protein [Thalassotalea sp. Y01]NMP14837.1 amino acid adenylation domain-containing protein [Thalassotalea sp. Y01]